MKGKGNPAANSKYSTKGRVIVRTEEKLETALKTFVSNMHRLNRKACKGTTLNLENEQPREHFTPAVKKNLSMRSSSSKSTAKYAGKSLKKNISFNKERKSVPVLHPPSVKKLNNFLMPKKSLPIVRLENTQLHPIHFHFDPSPKSYLNPAKSQISNSLQKVRTITRYINAINVVPKIKELSIIKSISNDLKRHSTCTSSTPVLSPESSQTDSEKIVVVSKYAYYSKAGCMQRGVPKINQDSFLINPKLGGRPQEHIFGIADGHGQYGREISSLIKRRLPELVEQYLKQKSIEASLQKAFLVVHAEVPKNVPDADLSGSTCNILYIKGRKVISANSGDSRSIVCSFTAGKKLNVQTLSMDHKPDDPQEAQRIIAAGGRIQPFTNEFGIKMGPLRVWQKLQDFPGLAMTRAIGDFAGSPAGIVPDPELREYTLRDEDRFIVLASDGIWEYMSNEEVASTIHPFYYKGDVEGAADAIVKEAHRRWVKEDEAIDDITCVVLFLALKALPL